MADGIPDYNIAVQSQADMLLNERIRFFARRLPISCPCTTKAATDVIEGKKVNYQLMTCKRCKTNAVWIMDKVSGQTVMTGTELYNQIIDHLMRNKK